ncbi:hypothetical protein AAFF_G00065940 [Aldrovandia affinis]|uniref:Hyaluronan/mRNA-binding protein domain-containing protein n=1 Tax=Aldrovandia affinis TaxID=143900 RepID=A0AAD7WY63_9TELE|nr:hypothetical protein AAFF_G00065940 [Aldrovandia affinis]
MQQDSFGCAVMNRFDRLLDDEADPFDILREAELAKQRKKKKDAPKKSNVGKQGKKESQKDRKVQSVGDAGVGLINATGRRLPPSDGRVQNENSGVVEPERPGRRVVFRECRPNQMEAPRQYPVEASQGRWDKGGRGRGRGRGMMEGYPRNMGSCDQTAKKEFDHRGGSDQSDWVTWTPGSVCRDVKDVPEAVETDGQTRATDGGVADAEAVPEVAVEMSLDEWRALQEQSRPKKELKLRKADAGVPSKAVVIHQSKHPEVQGDGLIDEDDDAHFFRRPTNDITAKLAFNFGNLPRPGRGGRGGARGRGGRGRGIPPSQPERPPAQAEVALAPNPDDPEDFPALA